MLQGAEFVCSGINKIMMGAWGGAQRSNVKVVNELAVIFTIKGQNMYRTQPHLLLSCYMFQSEFSTVRGSY